MSRTDPPADAPFGEAGEPPREGSGPPAQDPELPVNSAAGGEYECPMQTEATRLMAAVQGGDPAAFDDLVQRVRGRAFLVARSLVGSHEDAMDLCQEAFLKVFRARETYRPGQPFLPWFHRILRNTCFSHLRKRGRITRRSLSTVDSDGEELDWEISDPGPAPEEGVFENERAQLFQQALEKLSARDREILVLRHYQELSYKEIATSLGIPEGTVMSRLFHARRRLRDQLQPLLGEIQGEFTAASKAEGTR